MKREIKGRLKRTDKGSADGEERVGSASEKEKRLKKRGKNEKEKREKKRFGLSIRVQLIIGFMLPIAFIITVGVASYTKASSGLTENYEGSTRTAVEMTVATLEESMRNIRTTTQELAQDKTVMMYSLGGCKDSSAEGTARTTIRNNVNVKANANDMMSAIHEIRLQCPWAACGRLDRNHRNVVTSLELDSAKMEVNNHRFQATYRRIEENEVRFQEYYTEDADYLIVAFGSVARICLKAIEDARAAGVKIGLLRPITLWPFPYKEIERLSNQVKGILTVELNAGQMVEDVRLGANGKVPVHHFGRMGGIVPNPGEITDALTSHFSVNI